MFYGNWVWQCTPMIPVLRRGRQYQEFKITLGCIASLRAALGIRNPVSKKITKNQSPGYHFFLHFLLGVTVLWDPFPSVMCNNIVRVSPLSLPPSFPTYWGPWYTENLRSTNIHKKPALRPRSSSFHYVIYWDWSSLLRL